MTPIDLIKIALKAANITGIGQTPDAEDVNDCFTVMNSMLAQWNRKRWLVPNLVDTAKVSTGALSYTLGTGGDFNVPHTDNIDAAYIRILPVPAGSSPVDIAMNILEAREDWSAIVAKQVVGFSTVCFYDATYPLGTVYFYPVAQATRYELHLVTKYTIPQMPDLTTPFNLPDVYTDGLIWNLACRIRPIFGAAPDPTLLGLAKTSLNVIRGANAQVPLLSMPPGISGQTGGRWIGHGMVNSVG